MAHPILDLPMKENDADAATIRDYLKLLLTNLIQEREGFSGKRPFGNSGWEYELYAPLVSAKAVKGLVDEYGHMDDVDEKKAIKVLLGAIKDL